MNGLFRPREYHRPNNLQETTRLLSAFGKKAKVIAGGTDLLVTKPQEVECLVDIANLDLDYIRKDEDGISIGAATTVDLIETSPVFSKLPYRVLSQAANNMATPQVRNMATIGGNICNASPAADLPVALMVLDATVKTAGPDGRRILTIGKFFRGVNQTSLKDDELLVEVHIPLDPGNAGASFVKLKHHQSSVDIAIVSVAVRLNCSNGLCVSARIALGAVGKTPVYAKKAETILIGENLNSKLLEKAADVAAKESKPIDDARASAGYRRKMVAVLVKRTLESSMRRCESWQN